MNRHPTTPLLGHQPRPRVLAPSLNFCRPPGPVTSKNAHLQGVPGLRGVHPSERDRLPPGRPRRPGRGTHCAGALGQAGGRSQARSPPPATASDHGPAAPAQPARRRPAPRPPGPWRLRGCWSRRWSRARGARAGGKVRRRGSSKSRPGSRGPSWGEWGSPSVPAGCGAPCGGLGTTCLRSPARDLGVAEPGRMVRRPASRRSACWGCTQPLGEGTRRCGARGGQLGPGRARRLQGDARGRGQASREGPGCCRACGHFGFTNLSCSL